MVNPKPHQPPGGTVGTEGKMVGARPAVRNAIIAVSMILLAIAVTTATVFPLPAHAELTLKDLNEIHDIVRTSQTSLVRQMDFKFETMDFKLETMDMKYGRMNLGAPVAYNTYNMIMAASMEFLVLSALKKENRASEEMMALASILFFSLFFMVFG